VGRGGTGVSRRARHAVPLPWRRCASGVSDAPPGTWERSCRLLWRQYIGPHRRPFVCFQDATGRMNSSMMNPDWPVSVTVTGHQSH
jgi:hypothetical protein